MQKVFISLPMNGKTDEEIKKRLSDIKSSINAFIDDDYEIIDSFIENAPENANALWYLGESIKLLSTADIVVFDYGYEENRGCKQEFQCTSSYGKDCNIKKIIFLNKDISINDIFILREE